MQTLPLMSIEQTLNTYNHLNAPKPAFGMDVYDENFNPHGLVILQNSGKGSTGIPIRCDHYIMILTLKGGSIRHVNQHDYHVPQHGIQLLVPGVIHSFEDTEPNSQFYVILFERAFLDESVDGLLAFHKEHPEHVELDGLDFKRFVDMYETLNIEYKNLEDSYEGVAKSILGELLYRLKRGKTAVVKEAIQNRTEQICSQFLCLIEEHFHNRHRVREYADIMELTPKYLSETIKQALGQPALHYIHLRVMKEIQYLLVYSAMSIKQIASSLSFENSSQMGRFFKKYEGLSPKHYRIRHQKSNT